MLGGEARCGWVGGLVWVGVWGGGGVRACVGGGLGVLGRVCVWGVCMGGGALCMRGGQCLFLEVLVIWKKLIFTSV